VVERLTFVSERTITTAEFAAWVATRRDGARYELIGGRVVMTPPSPWPEGEGAVRVVTPLSSFVAARALGRVFGGNQGFTLPTGDVVAPGAAFISQARWDAGPRPVPGEFLRIVPELVVEVTTPDGSTRDRVDKRQIYAAAGVREYWIVDLRRREVTIFVASAEGRFDAGRTLGEADTLASTTIAGFSTPVRDLLVAL
jgi:Uma2 family endonuclease